MSRSFDDHNNRSESYNSSNSRRIRRRIDSNQENPEDRFGESRRNSAMQGTAEAVFLPQETSSDDTRSSQQTSSISQRDLVGRYIEEQELKNKIREDIDTARKDLEDELDILLTQDQQDLKTQPKQAQTHRQIPEENELNIFVGERLLPPNRGGGIGSRSKRV